MAEEIQEMTSFVTHFAQFAWRVMPFGLKNAAATFQRIMNSLLAPYQDYACAYLDDIAVHSASWDLEHIKTILSMLEGAGLTANLEKCMIAQGSLKYLGHIVGSGKHAPDPDKVAAIRQLNHPETKRQLRSVLGLCGYYRTHVPGDAEIAEPLTKLTAKKVPTRIPWSQSAFQTAESVFKR